MNPKQIKEVIITNKLIMILVVMVLCTIGVGLYRSHTLNRELGPNVALVEGECVVINWDATEDEALWAIAKWLELKK